MKKVFIRFVSFICFVLFLSGGYVQTYAKESKNFDTELGIEIEKPTSPIVPVKPPVIDGGNNNNNHLLPKTGEVLSSFIVVLIGISIFIFCLGILSLKYLYQETVWEV